mgnify:CR=1 FL=1
MATAEERLKVLKMLEAGTITTDEAKQLLTALGAARNGPAPAPGREYRSLRIRVRDAATGRQKSTVSIPLPLIDSILRWVARYIPNLESGRWKIILTGIKVGQAGKLLEFTDDAAGDVIELVVE